MPRPGNEKLSSLKRTTFEVGLYIILLLELVGFIVWVSKHIFR